MRYGLFYLPSSLPATRAEGAERFRTVVDQVAYGEAIGFESVWLAEHHFHPFAGIFSAPQVIGAAIAQRTAKMRIGTAVQVYFNARRATGFDPATARVLGVYHAYVGENVAEARAAAAPGLHEYHSAAQVAHSLTPGMADPESYRSHEKHRAAMKRLTFDDLVEQNRVLVGSAAEVREQVEYVRERLYLTDLAGNFALGGLSDAQTRASMRRFIDEVAGKVRRTESFRQMARPLLPTFVV